ncbi:phosphotransferase [Candidatus Uhrbacteria bacterium]|nr:phosphotransferase [Candidatus Uhrbacteria bacterium]
MVTHTMLRLFQPDIFSDPIPRFVSVDDTIAQAVRAILSEHYPALCTPALRIEQVRGNEINSTNVRVETEGGVFLVKRVRGSEGRAHLNRVLDIAVWLHGAGVPAAAIVPTRDGQTSMVDGDAQWCVFEFIPDGFFSGICTDELYAAGRAIGMLHRALKQIPDQLHPERTIHDQPRTLERIIHTCAERSTDWPRLFGVMTADMLQAQWGSLRQTFAAARLRWDAMERMSTQACHIDLHPHNLLVRDGSVAAFLDFYAVVSGRIGTAIAFATFKLVRQHAVHQRLVDPDDIAERGRCFVDAVREALPLDDEVMNTMLAHTQLELLRRICKIFSANVQRNDQRWNHVLPMHLAGLVEAETIFRFIR